MKALSIFTLFVTFIFTANAQYEWRHRACLPGPGRNARAFSLNNKGYAIGGPGNASQVWEYDPLTDSWLQKNNFPGPVSGVSTFVINDTAYAGLGQDSLGNYYQAFWKYNAATDQWTPIAPFTGSARYTAMSFVINAKGYVGCGKGAGQNADLYQYDPTTGIWTEMTPFPGAGRQSGIGIAAGGIGYMGLGYNGNVLNDVYAYNPVANTWSAIANYGGGNRSCSEAFAINDTFYVTAGGDTATAHGSTLGLQNDCWRYDTTGNAWIEEPDFACVASSRLVFGQFTLYGHGYLVCGNDSFGERNDILEFGPADTAFYQRQYVLGNDTNYNGAFSRTLSTGNNCSVWSTGYVGSQITVTSNGTYSVLWPDSCGVNTDTINFGKITSGIAGLQNTYPVNLYPNPSTTLAVVDAGNRDISNLKVVDLTGRVLFCSQPRQNRAEIDCSNMAAGIYFVELVVNNITITKQLAIER